MALLRPKYRPDIDGLRAIAVLSVVCFHAFPRWLPGGLVGVDIFFVISGYLISLIIFSNLEQQRYSFIEFYSRRIKRIFPALLAVLLGCFAFGWYALYVNEFEQLGEHIAGGAGFVSNFISWAQTGYFDRAAPTKPLLHLWTLAIEEQFYLVWPLLLAVVWKKKGGLLAITAALAIASFLVNVSTIHSNPTAAFYSPGARWWELMLGGLLAYVTLHRPQLLHRWRMQRSILGFALLAAGLALINSKSAFPGYWALLPTIGTVLLISAGETGWLHRRVLANKGLVWIGLISYPLYLWHWPLLSYARIVHGDMPSRNVRVATVLISIVLAWITYELVEKPIRFGPHGREKLSALLAGMGCLLLIGVLANREVIAPRHDNAVLGIYAAALDDWDYPGNLKKRGDGATTGYYVNSRNPRFTLFLGDSHVEQYAPRIANDIQRDPVTTNGAVFVAGNGCLPIPGVLEDAPIHLDCRDVVDYAGKLLNEPAVKDVVIGACWNCYFIDELQPSDYDYYFSADGRKEHFRGGHGSELALNALGQLIRSISRTKPVYLLRDNPSGHEFDPRSFFSTDRLGKWSINPVTPSVTMSAVELKLRATLITIARQNGAQILDPLPMLCRADRCERLTARGIPIYKDYSHLRPFFVKERAGFIDKPLVYDSAPER